MCFQFQQHGGNVTVFQHLRFARSLTDIVRSINLSTYLLTHEGVKEILPNSAYMGAG